MTDVAYVEWESTLLVLCPWVVLLHLGHAREPLGELVGTQVPRRGHPDSADLRWGPRICISNKLLAHVASSCLWTIL